MSEIRHLPQQHVSARPVSPASAFSERLQAGRTGRVLAASEHHTVVRSADVQAEGFVTAEKLRETDRLAHTAMSGHAFLAVGPTTWPVTTSR